MNQKQLLVDYVTKMWRTNMYVVYIKQKIVRINKDYSIIWNVSHFKQMSKNKQVNPLIQDD